MTTITVAGFPPIDPATVHSPVQISHGRTSPTTQPDPPTASWSMDSDVGVRVGQSVTIDHEGSRRFTGRVASVTVELAGTAAVSCVGRSAQLGGIIVGFPTWPAQGWSQRRHAFVVLADEVGMSGTIGAPKPYLSTPWDAKAVGPLDVDRRPMLDVLMDFAAQTGGIGAESRGGEILLEGPDYRAVATQGGRVPVHIDAGRVIARAAWTTDATTIINRVVVRRANLPDLEASDAASIAAHGQSAISIESQFTAEHDAVGLAEIILGRWAVPRWVLGQVTIDADDATRQLEVSDLVSIPLTEDPAAIAPTVWVVEGWDETLAHDRHEMTLRLSPAARYGFRGLSWADWAGRTWAAMAQRKWTTAMEGV